MGSLRRALVSLGVCFALLLGLLLLLGFGIELGPRDLKITMAMAFVPVPIYVLLVLWLDRIEKEPVYLLVMAFLYGATFATCLASIPNDVVQSVAGKGIALVVSAPMGEEFFKGLFILGVFLWRRDEFDGVIDGVVYAAMVGLGFAAMENIEYYGKVVHEGAKHIQDVSDALRGDAIVESRINVFVIFLLRGVFGPFAHPLFTSMTGIGFGLAQQTFKGPVRAIAPLMGYALAVVLHAIWNFTAGIGGLPFFIAAYVLIFLPTFVGLAILARYSLKKECQLIREQLLTDVNNGYLSPADYEMVSSLRGRSDDLREANRRGGRALAAARRAFQQAVTDLAFHRFRVSRGITLPDPEADAAHFRTINEIQNRIAALAGA